MKKQITVDEWLNIASDMITTFCERFEDDGKISLSDGLALILQLLKDIAKAYKED